MTLPEFRDLCWREWANGRGDVLGLLLTDESYAELTAEALAERDSSSSFALLDGEFALDAIRSGTASPSLLNPVTLSAVKVAGGASIDSAEVRRYFARPHPAGIPCT